MTLGKRTLSIVPAARIWDRSAHNAFTDLARFNGAWYCVFRESSDHVRGEGRIRLLRSPDGGAWSSVRVFAQAGVDLRDPKLSVTPDKRLMLLAGGTLFDGDRYVGRQPRVAFSIDGTQWSRMRLVLENGDWLWRVSWHGRRAYGITYRLQSSRKWTVALVASSDGLAYEELCDLGVDGKPNEATIRFRSNGEAVAVVRREGGDRKGWVGTSRAPYTSWSWHSLAHRLGGPNFLILPNGEMWASTRIINQNDARTCVGRLTDHSFQPLFELPSGGDCSYPGMVWFRQRLWVSYYSSHGGKTSIYLSRIGLS